jgi:hypothetical protein
LPEICLFFHHHLNPPPQGGEVYVVCGANKFALKLLLLPAAPCKLPAEYPLAFFKEAIIFIAVSFQLSAK